MARSPLPSAINASMAALTGSTTTSQGSDLPLRNYASSSEAAAEPSPGDLRPAASHPASNLRAPPPETPSSVAAEYGDGDMDPTPSAAAITNSVFESYSRSRSRSGPATRVMGKSQSESRSQSLQRRDLSPASQAVNDKVHRFLRSMSPPNPMDGHGLAKENRSLHQRIAALQRTERDLLNDNQELARREKVFEARIKDLEARLARQEEELLRIALDRSRETALNDSTISAWFASKANTWRVWADDFAHRDPNRLRSGLHPVQLRELCDGVKHFVRLTEKGDLPDELLVASGNDGTRAVRLLLQGMLANFIISETLASPFWVFDVISGDPLELESPSILRLNSVSPVGFRMDLAMWNFSIAPPRDVRSPRPLVVPLDPLAEPPNTRKHPRLMTSIQPPSLSTGSGAGLLDQDLPTRQAMEGLYRLLSNVRGGDSSAKAWRNSVMKSFCEGGMSTEDGRLLAEARTRFAGRLKDKFLRGPARFLLQDQDSAGIEKLERRLVQEFDATLRFTCQLWCRHDTPQVKSLHDLTETTFTASRADIELCQAQAPLYVQSPRGPLTGEAPPGYHDGHSVIMVVQPSVGVAMTAGTKKDAKVNTKIWTKASVLVAAPKPPVQELPAAQDTPTLDSASVKATVETPVSAAPPPVPPKDAKEPVQALILLPSLAFKDISRPVHVPEVKQPPSLAISLGAPPLVS